MLPDTKPLNAIKAYRYFVSFTEQHVQEVFFKNGVLLWPRELCSEEDLQRLAAFLLEHQHTREKPHTKIVLTSVYALGTARAFVGDSVPSVRINKDCVRVFCNTLDF